MRFLLRWLAVAGLAVQLVGSTILIFYGTAGHIATGGYPILLAPTPDLGTDAKTAAASDRLHVWLNNLGFMLICLGTVLQIGDSVARARQ